MIILRRNFYHKICKNPQMYATDTMTFDSIIQAKDFCYQTYRYGYSTMEIPRHMVNLPTNMQLIVYESPVCRVECYLEFIQ